MALLPCSRQPGLAPESRGRAALTEGSLAHLCLQLVLSSISIPEDPSPLLSLFIALVGAPRTESFGVWLRGLVI